MIIKIFKILLVSMLLLCAVISPVFAKGVTVEMLGDRYVYTCGSGGYSTGTSMPEGETIQFINTQGTPLPPLATKFPSGTDVLILVINNNGTGLVGGSNLAGVDPGVGQFKYGDNGTYGGYLYVRVWWIDAAGTLWYGNSQVKYINPSDMVASEPWPVPSFPGSLPGPAPHFWIAAAPPAPTVAATLIGYNTALKPLVRVTITADFPLHELASNPTKFHYDITGGAASISGDTNSTSFDIALELGTTYTISVFTRNYFDNGPPGTTTIAIEAIPIPLAANLKIASNADKSITLSWTDGGSGATAFKVYKSTDNGETWALAPNQPGSGAFNWSESDTAATIEKAFYRVKATGGNFAPQTVGMIEFDLKKSTTGVNSIAIPFKTDSAAVDPASKWADMTADTLKTHLNTQAGGDPPTTPYVEFIGGWDEATQTQYARLYNTDGTFKQDVGTRGNFPIEPKVGYQVSVSAAHVWRIIGQVTSGPVVGR